MGFILADTFYTERWAAINDWRLAYTYSLGWWLTLTLGLWSIIFDQGYLQLDDALRGVIRPRLNNRPTTAHHSSDSGSGDVRKFSPSLSVHSGGPVPAYCQGSANSGVDGWDGALIDCELWDPMSVSRTMGPRGIFVATRLQERQQVSVCPSRTVGIEATKVYDWGRAPVGGVTRPVCRDGFHTEWVRQAYLEGVEDFVLQADGNIEAHTFAATSTICGERINWDHDNKELDGALVGLRPPCRHSGPEAWWRSLQGIKDTWSCFSDPPAHDILKNISAGTKDAFPLHMWLKAAGVLSLDNKTDARKSKAGLDSFRAEGMVLEVSYEYSNIDTISFATGLIARLSCSEPAPFRYKIKVERVAGSEYKMEEVVSQEQSCNLSCPPGSTESDRSPDDPERCCGTRRLVHRLHGLLINFEHSGTAGQFSFTAIPNQLVYTLGYVTILKKMLDFVWSVVFPLAPRLFPNYLDFVYTKAKRRKGSGDCKLWKRYMPSVSSQQHLKDLVVGNVHSGSLWQFKVVTACGVCLIAWRVATGD